MADETTLRAFLSLAGVQCDLAEVGYARTAQEAAEALGAPLTQIVKSLVCLVDGRPVIALVTGDRSLSLDKLGAVAQAERAVLARGSVVETVTGYAVGAVAPVVHPSQLPVFGDLAVGRLKDAYFGGGSHHHMLRMAPRDLERLTPVVWADLASDEPEGASS